ncbi:MAG: type 1 glutamine amidotransferase [Phycisphaeraceae bacterium]|nr:type 1 glutamine amidotransferase [Phycisphaeraceae bacterium]
MPHEPNKEPIMELSGKRVVILAGDDYEDMELQYPKYRLLEAGAEVIVAGLEKGVVVKGKHSYPQRVEHIVSELNPADFDGVVIPGGWMPDKLRRFDEVKRLVRSIHDADRVVASICHGPWIDISADVVRGYRYTSTPALIDDLTNAGASWEDAEVVVDRKHISSRRPDDLPAFMRRTIEVLAQVSRS